MGALLDAHKLTSHADFIGAVRAAVMHTALTVFAEPASTPNHGERLSLARTVFLEQHDAAAQYTTSFVWLAAANTQVRTAGIVNGTVNVGAIPDTAILTVVQTSWNAVSGQT